MSRTIHLTIQKPRQIHLSIAREGSHEIYGGPYEVDPKFEVITLETANKLMTDDVIVNEIAVARVENPAGGITVTIGGN